MAREVWLIGGYGDVGEKLAKALAALSETAIVIAGRNGEKAEATARRIGAPCRGEALDITAPGVAERLAGAAVVVNLSEATPPDLAAKLIERGTHFVDTSATADYAAALSAHIGQIRAPKAAAVLEVGLAPGLTNLLAHRIVRDHPETRQIDLLIEMGMGEHHGRAATEWTLQNLGQTYPGKRAGAWVRLRPGAERRRFSFGDAGEQIAGIGFGFSDQVSIARDLDLDGARTFLALDPGWVTTSIGLLAGSALGRFVAARAGRVAAVLGALPVMGGCGTRLVVEGKDGKGQVTGCEAFRATGQAEITALVAALVARAMLTTDKTGLVAIYDAIEAEEVLELIKDRLGGDVAAP